MENPVAIKTTVADIKISATNLSIYYLSLIHI